LSADPAIGDAPLTVSFDAGGSNDPDGDIVKYEWDWEGDGVYDLDSGTDSTVDHEYTIPGNYPATVRVTDDGSLTATDSVLIAVTVGGNQVPTVDLSADPTTGEAPLTVSFDAGGSYDADGDIVKYEWDWEGDGNWDLDSGLDFTVDYEYTAEDDYDATVRVTDDDGATATASVQITVVLPELVADAKPDSTSGIIPLTVDFTGSASGGAPPYTYQWDFTDDGNWDSIEQNPSHEYVTCGLYTARLRVTDSTSNWAEDTSTIAASVPGTWTHTWGGSDWDGAYGVTDDAAGNVYVVGETISFGAGDFDILVLKYSADGTLLWAKTWAGSSST